MEMKMIELNDSTIELMQLMSEGKLTLEAMNIIIDALNKGNIQATFQVHKKETYQDGLGAYRTRELKEMEDRSYIEVIANDFHAVMIKYGEDHAIKHLTNVVKPVKKYYKRK